MDRSEPALVPEWLKVGGSLPAVANSSHISASASQPFDDHPSSKLTPNKSALSSLSRDTRRSSILERTTSAYLRRSSSGNGFGHLRSSRSFGRSQRDRDWADSSDYNEKEKLVSLDNRHYDNSDPLGKGNILPTKLDKDKFWPSQSMITGKQDNTWSKKVSSDLINSNKERHKNNGSGLIPRVGGDSAFEQDFPSLGAEERQSGIVRVSSPVLSAALQTGTAPMVGENWKSALADVPVVTGNSNLGHVSLAPQAVPTTPSTTMVSTVTTGLKMAEALAQGPPRARTPPQATAGMQRFEELAIRQSKLIPMTPSTAKTLVVGSLDKTRPKIGLQQQHSVPLVNHSRGVGRSDAAKVSPEGRLQILKPSRELNGISSAVKDTLSPNGSKVVNSSVGLTPLAVGSTPLRSSGNSPKRVNAELHPSGFRRPTMEKRPTSQVQSRNEFFNDLKKKSSANSNSAVSDPNPSPQSSISEMSGEAVKEVVPASVPPDHGMDCSSLTEVSSDTSRKKDHDEDVFPGHNQFGKREKDSYPDVTPNPDEEEAAFLRSLGWEENADEDEGLTEEEIRAFYEEYMKLRPSTKLHGLQPASRVDSHIKTHGVDSSSALSSSDSDSDS